MGPKNRGLEGETLRLTRKQRQTGTNLHKVSDHHDKVSHTFLKGSPTFLKTGGQDAEGDATGEETGVQFAGVGAESGEDGSASQHLPRDTRHQRRKLQRDLPHRERSQLPAPILPPTSDPWANVGSPTAGTGSTVTLYVFLAGQTSYFFRVSVQ